MANSPKTSMASTRTQRAPRVFIDSSVLIAAAISNTGSARDLVLAGYRGDLHVFLSDLVLEETERNLRSKAPAAVAAFRVFRRFLPAVVVNPNRREVLKAARFVNGKDAPIVAAAARARADYLASYDRELLGQKREVSATFSVLIQTPKDIVRRKTP